MADLYNVVVLFVPRVDDRDVKIVVKVKVVDYVMLGER